MNLCSPLGHLRLAVALTGWGQKDQGRRSERAGFDAHLVKPVDDAVLEKLLMEIGTKKFDFLT